MNKNNGRVDIKTPNTSALFELYDRIPANQCVTFRNPTEGLWTNNRLSAAFFSQENIQTLQNGIRSGVYHLAVRDWPARLRHTKNNNEKHIFTVFFK